MCPSRDRACSAQIEMTEIELHTSILYYMPNLELQSNYLIAVAPDCIEAS